MDFQSDYWDARYADGQTGWDRGKPHPALQHWIETRTLSPCSIVVPGCGRGHEVVALAEHGFSATGLDYAQRPVTELQARLSAMELEATVVHQSVFQFETPAPVDAVYEQTCLCAISPARRNDYEQKLFQWLKPNGRLFALFAQTDAPGGPPFHCDWQDMKTLFDESRWEWPDSPPTVYEHPTGKLFEKSAILTRRS